jgi:hypothetical protein
MGTLLFFSFCDLCGPLWGSMDPRLRTYVLVEFYVIDVLLIWTLIGFVFLKTMEQNNGQNPLCYGSGTKRVEFGSEQLSCYFQQCKQIN